MPLRLLVTAAVAALLSFSTAHAEEGVLDVVAPFEIKGTDPATSGNIYIKMAIAETLVDADVEGRLRPGLAASWQVAEDGLEWRFQLRPDVRFHDGSPLTGEAAALALNVARTKPGLLDRAPIREIVADGDEVVILLDEPFAPLPAFLAEYRSLIYAPAAYAEDGGVREVIGTGPYRLTRLEPPLRLEALRFEDYWGEAAVVERVAYQAVGRAETRALLAESGDADYVFNLDPASLARLAAVDTVDVLSVSIPRSLMLKVNAAHPFLADPRARRALSLAIDRDGLAEAILRYPAAADQLFPPSVGEWHSEAAPPLRHDPEEAKALLAELGWQAGADGVLVRDGERFALTLTTYPDRPELPLSAAVLQQMLADLGIEVVIDSTNSSEIPVRHADGTLDIALIARNFALVPDPIGTILTDYAPGGDWGAMGWDNAEFTALIRDLAAGRGGQAERDRAIEILQTDLPVIPVAWYQQTAAVSTGIEGAVIDPYERSIGLAAIRWAER